MKKLIKDILQTNGKWSYKRITSLYILNVAIIYAVLPIWFKNFDATTGNVEIFNENAFIDLSQYNITYVIKSYGKEGKVHCHLVFSHMPEPSVCHVVFHLSKNSFRFYTPPASMPDSFF